MNQPNSTTPKVATATKGGILPKKEYKPRGRKPQTGLVQTYVSFLEEDHRRLWRLAEKLKTPKQEVLRRALLVFDVMLGNVERGNEVVLRGPGGRWEQVVDREELVRSGWRD